MGPDEHLLIFGASARAAAFSALRAGLRPWCADLFADLDLRARCPVEQLPAKEYPHGFFDLLERAPPGPWMSTGGLENHPGLVLAMSLRRPLWGCDAESLERARSPEFVARALGEAGLPCPEVRGPAAEPPGEGRWLVKPLAGAGGRGIHFLGERQPTRRHGPVYHQEFIDGEPWSATYVGFGRGARLVGATRQLVGESWLGAAPFHYCGSVGPMPLSPALRGQLEQTGNVLADACKLFGVFGVDGVVREDVFWPVEVNPRYTASVEVLEHTSGIPVLASHCEVFDQNFPLVESQSPLAGYLGKAVLFARQALTVPANSPWTAELRPREWPWDVPSFADVPPPGAVIAAGRPVLTFFARGYSPTNCLEHLQRVQRHLDRWLYP